MKFPVISFIWFLVFGYMTYISVLDFTDGISKPNAFWFVINIMAMLTFGSRFILWYSNKMKLTKEEQ